MALTHYRWKVALFVVVLGVVFLIATCSTPRPANDRPQSIADPYEPCDLDRDGDCDNDDAQVLAQALGSCEDDDNYNELADADHDGCVTESDRETLFPLAPTPNER